MSWPEFILSVPNGAEFAPKIAAILVALAVDKYFGEPPPRWHVVVWMGRYLRWAGRHLQRLARPTHAGQHDSRGFFAGICMWLVGAALVAGLAMVAELVLQMVLDCFGISNSPFWRIFTLGVLLKPFFAWVMLVNEVRAVEVALCPAQGGSLAKGRERLRGLVSRDVHALSEAQIRESAIETLAENFNDSVVAPLFWFLIAGLPGLAVYRFANTADAMWGYRTRELGKNWEWVGKWAARVDDILSWIPARLSAIALLFANASFAVGKTAREAHTTLSPNGGWPMAAMAVVLRRSLGKPGVYRLNSASPPPESQDVMRSIVLAQRALRLMIGIVLAMAIASLVFERALC